MIDLSRISSFAYGQTGKLTFWLSSGQIPIVVTPQGNPGEYEKILQFVYKQTGFSLQHSTIEKG